MIRIAAIEGVRSIAHVTYFGGYFRDARNALPAFAVNVDRLSSVYPELNITQAQIDAMKATRSGALVGAPLAKKYGWKVGDKIPVGTTLWPNLEGRNHWSFDIVGIFDAVPKYARTSLGSGFWFNYDYLDESRLSDRHHVHQFIIQIDDPAHATAISAAIDKLFENSSDETRTQTENAAIQSQLKQLADIDFIANAIVGAVMFTLLFLTANTMMQSVRERIPELAVLKTLGFPTATICALVLAESLLLCLSAAIVGLLLAAGAIKGVGASLGTGVLPAVGRTRRTRHCRGAGDHQRAGAGAACAAAEHRQCTRGPMGSEMSVLTQVTAVSWMNIRTLPHRLGPSSVVIIGIAGVVAVLISVFAMSTGLVKALQNSGPGNRAIVVSTGAAAELVSALTNEETLVIADSAGVKRGPDGRALASAEMLMTVNLFKKDGTEAGAPLRGLTQEGFAVHSEIKIVSGRVFHPGVAELIVGKAAQRLYKGLEGRLPGRDCEVRPGRSSARLKAAAARMNRSSWRMRRL